MSVAHEQLQATTGETKRTGMDKEQAYKYVARELSKVAELLAMSEEDREKYDTEARQVAKQAYYTAEGQYRLGNNDPAIMLEPSDVDIDFIAETVDRQIKSIQTKLQILIENY